MDDKDAFFSSLFLNFFKPFIFSNETTRSEQHLDKGIDDSSHSWSRSPRESLLKSNQEDETHNSIRREDYSLHSPGSNLLDPNHGDNGDVFYHFSPSVHDGGFDRLFNFMNKMLEQAEGFPHGLFKENWDLPDFPDAIPSNPLSPQLPDSGTHHGYEYSHEEKRDRDLDDSSSKEIASLLKKPCPDGLKPMPPSTTSHFHSTSIVRIRRPDGVIEETRKYRDSNGREEVEVSTHRPGESDDNLQSQDRLMPGTFSSLLKHFPFRFF